MNQSHRVEWIRGILIGIGMVMLILAVALLFRLTRGDGDAEDVVETPSEVSHRVLFISSYNPLYFTMDEQIRGLQEGLYPHGIEYDLVYMDSKLFPSEEDLLSFHEMLKTRLSGGERKYDAVIAGDDAALQYVLTYRGELFPELPVVFFGVNDLALAERAAEDPMITGLYENSYMMETLSLAVNLFPDSRNVVAVHDESGAGSADMQAFYQFGERYPNHTFTDLDTEQMTHQELIDTLEQLAGDSILIYMTCYTDSEGNVYSMREMTGTIVDHAHSIPVFRNYEGGENDGVLGGVALDFHEHTRLAGEMVHEILDGKPVSEIPLVTNSPSRCLFDNAQLIAWGLTERALPSNAVILNRPESFLERHHAVFVPAVFIMAALSLFLIAAWIATKNQRKTADALRASYKELETSQETLVYKAEHDDFLDILNRRTMTDFLHNEVTADLPFSIVMADLDSFKMINEEYGHRQADMILKYLASLLKDLSLENGWLLGRYGGDEFLFYIPEKQLTVDHPITQKLLNVFRQPVPVDDAEVSLSASLGISVSDGVTPPEQQLANAESAMYEAKHRGRNGAFLFADEMKEKMREENRIKGKLVDAFENNGFYMVYQPQINAATREVSGFEALVRMREPGIYPGQFIPVAEKNGWIWKIGRITTKLVIEQLAAWRDAGYTLHPVSINYSSNQMNDTGYLGYLENLLAEYDIPPQYIEIEITEGLFLDRTAQADNLFNRFKELGIRLLMDDFGTGYSSLGYLTYIPVDGIKLDKSLVDAYLVDGKDGFVRDVILLVHDLGKEMIIEGVEEHWQYERLCVFGADTIQGYYFSKPVSAEEAITFQAEKK